MIIEQNLQPNETLLILEKELDNLALVYQWSAGHKLIKRGFMRSLIHCHHFLNITFFVKDYPRKNNLMVKKGNGSTSIGYMIRIMFRIFTKEMVKHPFFRLSSASKANLESYMIKFKAKNRLTIEKSDLYYRAALSYQTAGSTSKNSAIKVLNKLQKMDINNASTYKTYEKVFPLLDKLLSNYNKNEKSESLNIENSNPFDFNKSFENLKDFSVRINNKNIEFNDKARKINRKNIIWNKVTSATYLVHKPGLLLKSKQIRLDNKLSKQVADVYELVTIKDPKSNKIRVLFWTIHFFNPFNPVLNSNFTPYDVFVTHFFEFDNVYFEARMKELKKLSENTDRVFAYEDEDFVKTEMEKIAFKHDISAKQQYLMAKAKIYERAQPLMHPLIKKRYSAFFK